MLILALDVDLVQVPSTPLQLLVVLLLLTALATVVIMAGTTVLSGWVDRRWPATEPLRPSELLWGEVGGHVARTFRGLDLDLAKDLTGQMVEMKVPAGSYIVEQGDAPTHFFVIKSGDAEVTQRIFSRDSGGQEQVIRRYGPGDSFGEVAILRRSARTASVRAVSDVVVLQLPAEDFVAGTTLSAADENQLLAAVDRYLAEDRVRMRAASEPAPVVEEAPVPESRAERRRRRLAEREAERQPEPGVEAVTPVAATTPEAEGPPAPAPTPGTAKKAAKRATKAAKATKKATKAGRRGQAIEPSAEPEPVVDEAPPPPAPPPAPPPPFYPSHVAPGAGLAVWDEADPGRPAREVFAAGTELQVLERWGEWAHVRRRDGNEGWVDGRLIEPAVTAATPDAEAIAAALREQTEAIAGLRADVAALRRELRGDHLGDDADVHDVDEELADPADWRRLGLADGERRHVTVLFADVSGFTALADQVDPEVCRLIMVDTMAALAEIVARYGGHIEKFIGDAVCAIFGAPVAHDDEPQRAVRASVEMHRAMVDRATSHPDLPPLEVHIGINTGLVIAGGVGDGTQFGVVGDTINTAARLMDKAANRQTFVSLETASRVRREFLVEDMGRHVMKGKQDPVPVFSVVRPLRGDERAEVRVLGAPLTGRDQELAELVDVARRPAGQQPVLITGDPGLGKTRLLDEVEAALLQDGILVLRAAAQVVCAQPLALVHDALVPLGVDLLHDRAPERAAAAALLAAAAVRPAAVLLDNVDHADGRSLELLAELVEITTAAPIVWILAGRPAPALHWARPIPLTPLTEDAAAELVTHLLHGAVSDDQAHLLARRAGGNPEFTEEIALALLDEGLIVQAGEGWRVTGDVASFPIPRTVHEMIEARIDALDTAARVALQDASVVGVRFSRALLAATATLPTTVDAALAELVAAELVRAPAGDDDWYSFRNPTVREVAYELMLHRRRPAAHRRVGEGLLELHPGEEAEMAEMLAHHFAAAGDDERAAGYRDLSISTGGTSA